MPFYSFKIWVELVGELCLFEIDTYPFVVLPTALYVTKSIKDTLTPSLLNWLRGGKTTKSEKSCNFQKEPLLKIPGKGSIINEAYIN